MEEKNIEQENNNIEHPKKKTHWSLKMILVTVIVSVIGAVVYYVGKDKLPSIDGVFTTYNPLPFDTTGLGLPDTFMINNTDPELTKTDTATGLEKEVKDTSYRTVGPADSTSYIEADTMKMNLDVAILDTTNLSGEPESNSIFKVNTSFEKIADLPNLRNEDSVENEEKERIDLFSELLLYDVSDKTVVDQIFSKNGISYQSILKLVSIAGQDIVIGNGSTISELMLDAIAESDNILEIYIIDRKGNLIYTTHKPKINTSIHKLLAMLYLDVNRVKVTELDGHFHISLPLYHTYGKIGIAVLSIK